MDAGLEFNGLGWGEEIEVFGESVGFQDGGGRPGVEVQLAAIDFGPLWNPVGCYLIGFEIYNEKALWGSDKHVYYSLNDYRIFRLR